MSTFIRVLTVTVVVAVLVVFCEPAHAVSAGGVA